MMYGMVIANAAKRAKRQTLKPSANERFSPKNRVTKPSMNSPRRSAQPPNDAMIGFNIHSQAERNFHGTEAALHCACPGA